MNPFDLRPDVGHASTSLADGREPPAERSWRELAGRIGDEINAPIARVLGTVSAVGADGRLDHAALQALRDDLERIRRVGLTATQISRFGARRTRPQLQRRDLTRALRDALNQRADDAQARGIAWRQALKPAEVLVDAAMLDALLQALLDWSFEQARSELAFEIDIQAWPAHAQLRCRFGCDAPAAAMLVPPAMDTCAWQLVARLAQALGLLVERQLQRGTLQLSLQFPRTLTSDPRPVPPPGSTEITVPGWQDSKPMFGHQVLVITARPETRARVAPALQALGVMFDFAASVAEAHAFCRQGLPHAIVYEAVHGGDALHDLRAVWGAQASNLAFIELGDTGDAVAAQPADDRAAPSAGAASLAAALTQAFSAELAQPVA